MNAFSASPVDDSLSVAPQVQPEDMRAISAAGFRSIINNRPDFEGGAGQPASAQLEAAARTAGLEYRYLPAPSAGYTPQQARDMAQAVRTLPHPVLAFCRTGRRSAALYSMGKAAA